MTFHSSDRPTERVELVGGPHDGLIVPLYDDDGDFLPDVVSWPHRRGMARYKRRYAISPITKLVCKVMTLRSKFDYEGVN